MIRELKASEIECRAQQVKEKGCILLLYKDARCDMRILDETFGEMGWQRKHQLINGNLFCTVEVWDKDKCQWISKEDVGTESNQDKEKGQASDSFKRACFNWGIGRELYTSPFIWINLDPSEINVKDGQGKKNYYLAAGIKFEVAEIGYTDKEISLLVIKDAKGKERFRLGKSNNPVDTTKLPSQPTTPKPNENAATGQETPNTGTETPAVISAAQASRLYAIAGGKGKKKEVVIAEVKKNLGIEPEAMTKAQYNKIVAHYESLPDVAK